MKMKWFVRSCIAAAVTCSAAAPANLLFAQGAKSQSASASAQEDDDDSVVVVGIAPIATMLPNIQHLARLVAGGSGAGTVSTILKQYTGGLDTSRPAGVFVTLDEAGTPTPIACLPLSNFEEFIEPLKFFGEPNDLGDGLYEFQLQSSIFLRKADGWLVVGQNQEAVEDFDESIGDSLKPLVAKYDLRVQVSPQNIPEEVVEFLFSQIQESVERSLESQDLDDKQVEETRERAQQMVDNLREVIDNTEKMVLGLSVNRTEKKTFLDFGSKFAEGSKFAKQLAQYKTAKATLSAIPQDTSMISGQALQFVGPDEIQQIEDSLNAGVAAAVREIEEKAKDDASAEKAKEFINKIVEIVLDSAREGKIESALNVTVESNLNIVGSFTVADGKKVEAIAADAAKALAEEPNVPVKLQVNTGKHGGANLHKLTAPLPPNADDSVRKIFGSNVTVAIATTPKSVHLAVGKDCDTMIKSAIDRAGAKSSAPAEMVKGRFNLTQLLNFIQSIESNPIVESMLTVTSAGADNITIDSSVADRQSVVRISLEDNVLKSISAGVGAAQGKRGGGF